MNNKILVSAIIAAHNEEDHIAVCIESLLSQTHKDIEIIIVENGESNDSTFRIAKSFENKHINVRTFTIPGKQKGPGNAWNYGVKQALGSIVLICGADLIYGKGYIEDGIRFLEESNDNAIIHKEEKCNNIHNLWARAFFKTRSTLDDRLIFTKSGLSKIFTLAKKEYVEQNPFNAELGYADDQTIFRKYGTMFQRYDLEIYHTNPNSIKDTWDHSLFVGKSLNRQYIILLIFPIFPLWVLYKSIIHLIKEKGYPPFIFFLPIYYSIRYLAYFKESFCKYFLNKLFID